MSSQAPANVGLSVDNELYYAVVEQVRSWLVEDGPLIQEIKRKAGKLDGRTLRRIAMSYAVNRGIGKKGKDGDTHAEGFARLLNNQSPWPSDLIERANRCAEVVREAQRKGYTKKLEASAVTKFSWFAQPAGWTVFDSIKARAMGIGGTSADVRMLNFYRRLVERNFSDVAKEIQQALDVHRLMDLHGTRVLDKLMMLRGADPTWRENTVTRCRDFLHLLPDAWRQKVEEAAECVARRVDTSHLLNR